MFSIVVVIHIILCVCLMGLVLVQQGKGADAGAIMGGGADGLIGAAGAGNVISKTTTGLAIGFMITSIVLVKFYDQAMITNTSSEVLLEGSVMEGVQVQAPAEEVVVETEEKVADVAAAEAGSEEDSSVAAPVEDTSDAKETKEPEIDPVTDNQAVQAQ